MDRVEKYRKTIEQILANYAGISYAFGEIRNEMIFDHEGNHYVLMSVGWDDGRVHDRLVHVDLIDGKFRIQRDGAEDDIARDLEAAGVPKEHIVLAFHEPQIREHTGYAVA